MFVRFLLLTALQIDKIERWLAVTPPSVFSSQGRWQYESPRIISSDPWLNPKWLSQEFTCCDTAEPGTSLRWVYTVETKRTEHECPDVFSLFGDSRTPQAILALGQVWWCFELWERSWILMLVYVFLTLSVPDIFVSCFWRSWLKDDNSKVFFFSVWEGGAFRCLKTTQLPDEFSGTILSDCNL
jgi:hypothetical protein